MSTMNIIDKIYGLRPVNKLAAHGLAGSDRGWVDMEKPPILINTDRLPDNSIEQRKYDLRQWRLSLKRQPLEKIVKRFQSVCVYERYDKRGVPYEYLVGVYYPNTEGAYPLFSISALAGCRELRELMTPFKDRQRAECAAVLASRVLDVKIARRSADGVTEEQLANVFPTEYRVICGSERKGESK